jgi:hypothetical protein
LAGQLTRVERPLSRAATGAWLSLPAAVWCRSLGTTWTLELAHSTATPR